MKTRFIDLNLSKIGIFLISFIFLGHQLFYILRGGVTWDETLDTWGSGKNIENFKFFITRQESFELSTLPAQWFGQLIKLPIYLFSRSEIINNLFSDFIYFFTSNKTTYIESFFNLRHFLLNFYIFLSIFVIYYFCKKVTNSYKLSLLILFFIFTNPIFIGHSMFNLTDVPMAIHILIASLVYIERIILNKADKKDFLIVGIFFGLSLLNRISAAAFLLPLGIYYLIVNSRNLNLFSTIKNHMYILISTIFVLLVGSPGFYIDPQHYINGLIYSQFTGQDFYAYLPLNGNMIFSLDWNPEYLLSLFLYKLPLVVVIFLTIGLFKLNVITSHLFRYSYVFLIYVLLVHEIYRPSVFNYFRHYLFLIPFICIPVAYVFINLIDGKSKTFKIIFSASILFYSIYTQTGLEQYKYVYVNELVNEESISEDCIDSYEFNGCGSWQTDYYGFSGKETMQIAENLKLDNVFICEPGHSYSLFIKGNDYWKINNGNPDFDDYGFWEQYDFIYNINHFNEFIDENSQGYFYILAIHSPGYKTCNFHRLETNFIDLNCKIDQAIKRDLRETSVNLNYIHYCEYST
tara:strand:+ start:1474 stop:3198 length:1725 start_codon:yes stop_codon:yes gene_type:complete